MAQRHRPARSVGARGGHEGPVAPGPSPPSESASTVSERPVPCEHRRRRDSVRSGTGADDDVPSSRRHRLHRRCLVDGHRVRCCWRHRPAASVNLCGPKHRPTGGSAGVPLPSERRPQRSVNCPGLAERRIRARPSVNAHPDVVRARDSAASRLAWRNNRHRSSPRLPRAPDEPSAALELSLDGTPSPVRRRPHRPAQTGRSVSRGYPGRVWPTPTSGSEPRRPQTDLRSAWSSASSENRPEPTCGHFPSDLSDR